MLSSPFRLGTKLFVPIVFALCFGRASGVHARPTIDAIHSREYVMPIAPRGGEGDDAESLGLKYERVSVFGLDVLRWNAEFCLYTVDDLGFSYLPGSPAQLSALSGVSEAEIRIPLTYYLPPGGVSIVILGLAGVPWLVRAQRIRGTRRHVLGADPRYRQAVAAFHAHPERDEAYRLDAGVRVLVLHGIPPDVGRRNLALLCNVDDEGQVDGNKQTPTFS